MSVIHESKRDRSSINHAIRGDRSKIFSDYRIRKVKNHYNKIFMLLMFWIVFVAMIGYYLGQLYMYCRLG